MMTRTNDLVGGHGDIRVGPVSYDRTEPTHAEWVESEAWVLIEIIEASELDHGMRCQKAHMSPNLLCTCGLEEVLEQVKGLRQRLTNHER